MPDDSLHPPTDTSLSFDFGRVLLRDRFHLKKQQQRLKKLKSDLNKKSDGALQEKFEKDFQRFKKRCAESEKILSSRQSISLEITFPDSLPVSERREELAELINNNQVVIVAGETGSGKTTQLSKLCLALGRGRQGVIAHTQPRRIAASSVASRIAEELKVNLGQEVGYQIRFKDYSTDNTLLKLMTDGVLLAEIPHDRYLEKYDTIIIDEAHERSLNIDFLLGYIKRILPKRPDLKVVITSATIDVERFAEHFNDAPVITVSGRTYPVEIQYRPLLQQSEEGNLGEAILNTLMEIEEAENAGEHPRLGDVLVFLPGEHDIRQASLLLRRSEWVSSRGGRTEILPLYARLNSAEQKKIFNPSGNMGRRVILATNVAETSLTVPGIRYVIDSGLARVSRYSHRSKVQRLPIEKVSQASANQRAGRCGRVAAGVCYRLYDEQDFQQRDEFTQPEIQRTNLSAVILRMQDMSLGEIEHFPFVEPPDQRLINDGIKQLVDVNAIDASRHLTSIGKQLARLPIDPRLARMLVQGSKEGCLKEVLIIVAALSIQDPRENPAEKREAAREKHSRFKDTESDFIGLINLWDYLEELRQELSANQFKKRCTKEFLSAQRVREWRETHSQLRRICRELGFKENTKDADSSGIHRALLSGLLTRVGMQQEDKTFEGVRQRIFRIFPASFLSKKPPKWIMAAELIETSQLFAHNVAKIDPLWVKELAAHLLKYKYSEPHWSARRGEVMAYRQSSLYGLVVESKHLVSYSKIDPDICHDIFIRSALAEENLKSNAAFYQHNRGLRQSLLEIEEKSRRRDLLASDEKIYQFYKSIVPEHINNTASFEKWRKKAEKNKPRLLFAEQHHYQANDYGDETEEQFPNILEWRGVEYKLSYNFQPGHVDDGITVRLPVTLLNRVPRFRFEWVVPGLLEEKCAALLRCLPKQHRRQLVPIPDTVKSLMQNMSPGDMPLHIALSEGVQKLKRITIPQDSWQLETLDDYYKVNFKLVDEQGKLLEQSRDLSSLINQYGHHVQDVLDKQFSKRNDKTFYTRWDFDKVEKEVCIKQKGNTVQSFPALFDEGDKVSIRLTDYAHIQMETHRAGVVRLAMLELSQQVKYLRKELLKSNDVKLKLSTEYDHKALLEDLIRAAFNHCFFAKSLPFSKQEYEDCLNKYRSELVSTAMMLEKTLQQIVAEDYKVRLALEGLKIKNCQDSIADIQKQRKSLFYQGFLYGTRFESINDLPKYFKALAIRLERLPGQVSKDLSFTSELAELSSLLSDLEKEYPGSELLPAAIEYRWMMEEYRVSLFAQQLKTKKPISAKRLEKQWQKVLDERRKNII